MRIEGTVVVVTGAGSGIGRALAHTFAASGASVVIGDIDGTGVDETSALIRSAGGAAVGVVADASTVDGISTLTSAARNDFGPVDVYVANAGIIGAPGLGDDEADWDRIIDVNVPPMSGQPRRRSRSGWRVAAGTSSASPRQRGYSRSSAPPATR